MSTPVKPEGYETWRSVSELAKYVGVSVRTIERWWNEGKLPKPHFCEDGMKLWSPTASAKVVAMRLDNLPSEVARQRRITS